MPPALKDAADVQAAAAQLIARPGFNDWTYQGLHNADHESLVIVTESDASRRLLRGAEACARGRFAWGYGGTGPHALAEVLILDILDDHVHCPACLGGSVCGASLITCPACGDSGQRAGISWAAETLVEKAISGMPQAESWELSRRHMLTQVAQQPRPRDKLRRLRRRRKHSY